MQSCWDFLEWLGPDTSTCVFMRLDDPADIVRASAVSRSWRQFVITNDFSKKLCLRICPEASNSTLVDEASISSAAQEAGSSTAMEMESLEREHRVYAYLSHSLVSSTGSRDCFLHCIGASSTDNFPEESIENTLEPSDRVEMRPSYWSSGGQMDPRVSESLIYRLGSDLCIVNEIKIQPFKAFFQHGNPIYSAKYVRFRMGHSKLPLVSETYITEENEDQLTADDSYVWAYTSPEFPMLQENVLQSFKLPRPVLCIGGVIKIELLGRVQKQAMDGLYYICICHVQVLGRSVSPALAVDITEGRSVLRYIRDVRVCASLDGTSSGEESKEPSRWHAFTDRIGHLGARGGWNPAFLYTLFGPAQFVEDDDGSDDDEAFA